MALVYRKSDVVRGGLIYALGDSIAALIADDLSWHRAVGMLVIGGTIYAFEIPNYFAWIDRRTVGPASLWLSMKRALLALAYFNPLWIARHIVFIRIISGNFHAVDWNVLEIGLVSFAINIPVALFANHLIQNKISLKNRFLASAIFSGMMAVYYSLSEHWFG